MSTLTSPPVKDKTHSWSVADFELYRPWLTAFIRNEVCARLDAAECRRIVIRAPVKSGKREMVEYLAMRDYSNSHNREHFFISAWYRIADEDQRKELKLHNLHVYAITSRKDADTCLTAIRARVAAGKTVVVHLDECDHGSGERQNLGRIYRQLRENAQVCFILYSATPQEVLFSGDVNMDEDQLGMIDDLYNEGEYIEYQPPAGFCGPAQFIAAGLVHHAKPFFVAAAGQATALSEQARRIITAMQAQMAAGSQRNFLIVRMSNKDGRHKKDKAIYKFLANIDRFPELANFQIWVDKGDISEEGMSARIQVKKIDWSNKLYWDMFISTIPVLIVHDQTASRSTECAYHHRVYATHDYRSTIQYGVVSQAQERVNHYFDPAGNAKYPEFQRIHVYGHKPTFKLSAGLIEYKDYLNPPWTMRKIDRRRVERDEIGEGDFYEIKNSTTNAIHTDYPTPLTAAQANDALLELGCNGDITLSSRIIGNMRNVPVTDSCFIPCTKETWLTAFTPVKNRIRNEYYKNWAPANPFMSAAKLKEGNEGRHLETGEELGYLRNWDVFDYTTDIETAPGWGVIDKAPRQVICYKDGELGVALRWRTGETKMENRLNAYKSMYPGR